MLKIYKVGALTYQFEEGAQPSNAVEVKPEIKTKVIKPQSKVATRSKK